MWLLLACATKSSSPDAAFLPIFRQMDTDADGRITPAEYTGGATFGAVDTDGSGALTVGEVRAWVMATNPAGPRAPTGAQRTVSAGTSVGVGARRGSATGDARWVDLAIRAEILAKAPTAEVPSLAEIEADPESAGIRERLRGAATAAGVGWPEGL
jgi:hypothetical protein